MTSKNLTINIRTFTNKFKSKFKNYLKFFISNQNNDKKNEALKLINPEKFI